MKNTVLTAFDIGGTKTRIGVSRDGTTLDDVSIFDTPLDPHEGVHTIVETIRSLAKGARVLGICGGMKGTIDNGIVYKPPRIVLWDGLPLAQKLSEAFDGAPTTVFNDTETIGLGEYHFGAGKGSRDMVYITVSTGIGGSHIVDGVSIRGTYNMELGHQIIDGGKELEELASGTAVQERYGVHPKDLSDVKALNELADYVAIGLYNTTLHLTPEVFVLGGSMIMGKNPVPLHRITRTFNELVQRRYPAPPRLVTATLGDQGGLYGGIGYLKQRGA